MARNGISTSWDPAQVTRDMFAAYLQSSAGSGRFPMQDSVAPIPQINSAEEGAAHLSSLTQRRVQQRGGFAFDMYNTPVGEGYAQKRYDFLVGAEASREYAYDDATGKTVTDGVPKKGKITVGIGFNMDRKDGRQVFKNALDLTDADFDAVYTGKQKLTPVQIRRLFDYNADEAENVVKSRLGDAPLTEHQRLALVSMAFNGPSLIGPKITAATKAGNTAAALEEILNNSNAKNIGGLWGRRYKEAVMFAGGASNLAELGVPDYKTYVGLKRGTMVASGPPRTGTITSGARA
jgi:GH24 family phage-related lysozyme (muramidase)